MRDETCKSYKIPPMDDMINQMTTSVRVFGKALTLGLGLLVLLSACASKQSAQQVFMPTEAAIGEDLYFPYAITQATIGEGLRNISTRYIDPISVQTLAISGMRGLATIDPKINVAFDKDRMDIEMIKGGTIVAHLVTPLDNTTEAWASVVTKFIRITRLHSPDTKHSDSERILEAVFDGMMSNLDIFSRYAGREQAKTNRAQRDGFGGIGIRFSIDKNDILITHVTPKSPASNAGLKPGDLIVKVQGFPIHAHSKRNVKKLLHGPVGSLLSLTVERLSSQQNTKLRHIDFNIQRSHIIPETVRAEIKSNILIIHISSFNNNTSTSVHSVLNRHKKKLSNGIIRGIVLDLRGNPGGLLSQSVTVADLFLKKGRIITTHGRHADSVHEYEARGVDLTNGLPLVILIDGNSASAAEIVASALQDLGRAVLIGSESYGKGTVQTVTRLPNDGEMTLTWSRLISPTGYALHGLGVMPAVCITNTGLNFEQTESISKAILDPTHIKRQQAGMLTWHAKGSIFDGTRKGLRKACPAQVFTKKRSSDLLFKLADRVIKDRVLYRQAILMPAPTNTAFRQ